MEKREIDRKKGGKRIEKQEIWQDILME